MTSRETYENGVTSCARCGNDHEVIIWFKFQRPIVDEDGTVWGWWGMCPATDDPILLRADRVPE